MRDHRTRSIAVLVIGMLAAPMHGATAQSDDPGAGTMPELPAPFGAAGNGLIAFVRDGDIYVVRPDGSELRQISSGPDYEWGPRWSRDGTRLAYWSGPEDTTYTLFVTDADGEGPLAIAQSLGPDSGSAEWTADGSEIMYSDIVPELASAPCPVLSGSECGSRLFVAGTDGSGSRQVGDPDLDARAPALSPDGTTVAFGGGQAANEAPYLMDWDGSDVRRLETGIPGGGHAFGHLSWSPEGDSLVTQDGQGRQSIWLVKLDAGELATASRVDTGLWPNYAPDGSGIQFLTDRSCIVSIHDTADASVTSIPGPCAIEWSPDGTHLVGEMDGMLVVFDRTGGEMTEIGPGDHEWPGWQRVAR